MTKITSSLTTAVIMPLDPPPVSLTVRLTICVCPDPALCGPITY